MDDYYEILQVSSDASQEEIKKSYNNLTLKYHPDINHTSEALEKYKKINCAYSVISNPQKRKEYDLKRQYGWQDGQGQNYKNANDLFGQVFNEDLFDLFTTKKSRKKQEEEQKIPLDIEITVELSIRESFKKIEKTIKYSRLKECTDCQGRGLVAGQSCTDCQGTGMITTRVYMFFSQQTCNSCRGYGRIYTTCKSCREQGYTKESLDAQVLFEGYYDRPITLKGRGNIFKNKVGNIVIKIRYHDKNRYFKDSLNKKIDLKSHDLYYQTEVLASNPLISFTNINNEKIVWPIELKTSTSRPLLFKNRGLLHPEGYRGNLYLKVEVIFDTLPTK